MNKDDDIKVIPFISEENPVIPEQEEKVRPEEALDLFLEQLRLLYMDIFSDEDEEELDPETIRASYQLQRELRYAVCDQGQVIHVILALYLDRVHDINRPSDCHESWYDLFSDDDMRVNAIRIMNMVHYEVIKILSITIREYEAVMREEDEKKK